MFCLLKKKKYILPVLKHNSKPSYFLNDSKGRRMALSCSKKLSAILRGIMSKHQGDFYYLNCLHSFTTENKRKSYKKVCENKDFCNIVIPSKDTKILEFNQYQKSDKAPFIIYADLECSLEKFDEYQNNPEILFTTKVGEHNTSSFLIYTISLFKSIENKHDVYRGEYCMKKFRESLREHAVEIINLKKDVIKGNPNF